jgi:hypothetical protein
MCNVNKTYTQVLYNCAALGLQSSEEDFKQLMQLLALPMSHWEGVLLILQQGRWRNIAEDPVRYIRVAACREHRRLERGKRYGALVGCISELKLPRNKDGSQMNYNDAIDRMNTGSLEGEWETQFAKQRVHPKFLIRDSPYEDAHYTVDYSKLMDEVASITGLSKVRRDAIEKVLDLKSICHISREQILSYSPDPAVRKQLQAALKWMLRNHALLKKVLSGQPAKPVLKSTAA